MNNVPGITDREKSQRMDTNEDESERYCKTNRS